MARYAPSGGSAIARRLGKQPVNAALLTPNYATPGKYHVNGNGEVLPNLPGVTHPSQPAGPPSRVVQPGSMGDVLGGNSGGHGGTLFPHIPLPNINDTVNRDVSSPEFYYGANGRGFGTTHAPLPAGLSPANIDKRGGAGQAPTPYQSNNSALDFLKNTLIGKTTSRTNSNSLSGRGKLAAPVNKTPLVMGSGRNSTGRAPVAPSLGQGRTGAVAPRPAQAAPSGGLHPVTQAIGQARNAQHAQATAPAPLPQLGGGGVQPQQQDDPYAGINARAANAADLEITPQEQALQRQGALDAAGYDYANAKGQADTTRTVNEQQYLYHKLNGQLQGQLPQIGGNYDDAGAKVKSLYDALQGSIGQQYGSGIDATTAEAQRLGLDPAIPQATGQMTADSAFLKGLAGSDSAVQQSTIGNEKANALRDALSNIATQAGQGAALSGNTLRDFNTTSNDNKFTQSQHLADLLGQASTLEGTRPGITSENVSKLRGLADQQQAASLQAQQAQFNADRDYQLKQELAQGTLSKDQADAAFKKGTLDIQQQDLKIKQQAADLAAKKTTAELQKMADATTPGSLEYQKVMSAIALQQSQTNKNNTQSAVDISKAQQAAHTYPTGINGVNQYLDAGQNAFASSGGKTGISPAAAAIARHALNDILNHNSDFRKGAAESGIGPHGQSTSGYASAVHEMNNKANANGYDAATRDAMLTLLAIHAGR